MLDDAVAAYQFLLDLGYARPLLWWLAVTVLGLDWRWGYCQACCREGIPTGWAVLFFATDGYDVLRP